MLRRLYKCCIDAADKPHASWLMGIISFVWGSFFSDPTVIFGRLCRHRQALRTLADDQRDRADRRHRRGDLRILSVLPLPISAVRRTLGRPTGAPGTMLCYGSAPPDA